MRLWHVAALVTLGLPGGLALAIAPVWAHLFNAGKTGVESMDRLAMRGAIALWVILVFRQHADVATMRSLMAILYKESRGRPENFLGDNTGSVAAAGPSVGPLQVYRRTARNLGLVPDDITPEKYAALSAKPFLAIGLGVKTYKSKLADADGDHSEARYHYNGSGDMARAYQADADSFALKTFGAIA